MEGGGGGRVEKEPVLKSFESHHWQDPKVLPQAKCYF